MRAAEVSCVVHVEIRVPNKAGNIRSSRSRMDGKHVQMIPTFTSITDHKAVVH